MLLPSPLFAVFSSNITVIPHHFITSCSHFGNAIAAGAVTYEKLFSLPILNCTTSHR